MPWHLCLVFDKWLNCQQCSFQSQVVDVLVSKQTAPQHLVDASVVIVMSIGGGLCSVNSCEVHHRSPPFWWSSLTIFCVIPLQCTVMQRSFRPIIAGNSCIEHFCFLTTIAHSVWRFWNFSGGTAKVISLEFSWAPRKTSSWVGKGDHFSRLIMNPRFSKRLVSMWNIFMISWWFWCITRMSSR